MNKLFINGVGHILVLFLFLVQSKSATSLHRKDNLIPFVRNARQADAGCKLPPFPANGHYSTFEANVVPGQTVAAYTIIWIDCNYGYNASVPSALCLPTNTWSNQWQCERLEGGCIVPDPPENGSHELESKETLSPGTRVQDYTVLYYSCKAGYNSTATMSFCANGIWSPNPKCERLEGGCIVPDPPENGSHELESKEILSPGTRVQDYTVLHYSCKAGFNLTATMSYCNDGIWSPDPKCESNGRQDDTGCKLPPFPANGRYSTYGANVAPGQTVAAYTLIDIECDYGYNATAAHAYCQPTNTWSNQWQCEKLEGGCVVPDPPENGSHELESKVTLSPGTMVEDYTVLHYFCKAGYDLTVTMSLCIDRKWSETPKCERTSCILPKMPANGAYVIQKKDGVLNGSSVEDLTILEYTCNKGYVVTNTTSVCQRTIWVPIPICEKLCNKLESDSVSLACNPVMEDGCPVGSVIIPSCKAGYISNRTLETMTCLDGEWDVRKPKCDLKLCEKLESDSVSLACNPVMEDGCPVGSVIIPSCKAGYMSNRALETMTCLDGEWDVRKPKCDLKLCNKLESDSVSLACSPVMEDGCPVGSVIIPSCKAGYISNRTLTTMTCLDGEWDVRKPKCDLKLCNKLESDSVSLACNPVMEDGCPVGSVVIPSCKAGYISNRTLETMTCLDGKWDVRKPKCDLKLCNKLESDSVSLACSPVMEDGCPVGSVIIPSCKAGYISNRTLETMTCLDGKWDVGKPKCDLKLCEKLESDSVSLACSPVMEDGCPVGSVIIPSCKVGYRSNRTLETMTCLDGKWDVRKPKCDLITCKPGTSTSVNFPCHDSDSKHSSSNKIAGGKAVYFTCFYLFIYANFRDFYI